MFGVQPQFGVRPSSQQTPSIEEGFSTNESINLRDKVYKSGLETTSYSELTNITAPRIKSGASCNLRNCKIDTVIAESYLEANDSQLGTVTSKSSATLNDCTANEINSKSYVEAVKLVAKYIYSKESCTIKNSPNIADIRTDSYLDIKNSNIGTATSNSTLTIEQSNARSLSTNSYFEGKNSIVSKISAVSSATLENMQDVKYLTTNSYAKIIGSSIEEVKADSEIEAENSTITELKGGSSVILKATKINGDLKADSLKATGGQLVTGTVDGKAELNGCNVIQSLFAKAINGSACDVIGQLKAKSEVIVKDVKEIGGIECLKATIVNSKVLGNIDAINAKLTNISVLGTLTTADQELVLNNCNIPKIVMKKPQLFMELNTVQIHELFQKRNVPQDLRQLVEYILLDKAKIQVDGNKYTVTIGNSKFSCTANNYSNMSFESDVVFSVGIRRNISNIGRGVYISNETMTTGDGNSFAMDVLNNAEKLQQVQHTVNQLKADFESEKRRIEEERALDPLPQVVVVCGGHIEEIIFKTKGGVVLCERGGTVGKITGPNDEEINANVELSASKEKAPAAESTVLRKVPTELPKEYESPISFDIMIDPYKTPLGHHYDKIDIINIMATNNGVFKCALTRKEFTEDELKRDDKLREEIESWLETHIPI